MTLAIDTRSRRVVANPLRGPPAGFHEAQESMPDPATPPPRPGRAQLAMDGTPDPHGAFPFYCPICMMAFRRILSAQCCENYICEVCAAEMIDAHVAKAPLQRALRRTAAFQQRRDHMRATRGGDGINLDRRSGRRPSESSAGGQRSDLSDPDAIWLDDCNVAGDGCFEPVVAMPCPFCTRHLTVRPVARQTSQRNRGGGDASLFGGLHAPDSTPPAAPRIRNYQDSPSVAQALQRQQLAMSGPTPPRPQTSLFDATPPPLKASGPARPASAAAVGSKTRTTPLRGGAHVVAAAAAGGHSGSKRFQPATGVYSPVKTGDEFEALRRKLRPLGAIDPNSAVGKEHAQKQQQQRELQQRQQLADEHLFGVPNNSQQRGGGVAPRQSSDAFRGPASGRPPLRPAQPGTATTTRSSSSALRGGATTAAPAPKPEKKKDEGFRCVVM